MQILEEHTHTHQQPGKQQFSSESQDELQQERTFLTTVAVRARILEKDLFVLGLYLSRVLVHQLTLRWDMSYQEVIATPNCTRSWQRLWEFSMKP